MLTELEKRALRRLLDGRRLLLTYWNRPSLEKLVRLGFAEWKGDGISAK